jgi:DNA-binding XRE family transcriptional regulator
MKKTPDHLPSFHSSEFSTRLKDVRISAGYTQKELSIILGISRETISAVETNKKILWILFLPKK